MSEGKLTDKQRRFCEEYVIDWNGTRAAIAAGYSENTAKQIATENLSKPYLQKYISEIQNDLEKLSGMSALRNIKELMKIAFSSPANLRINWDEIKSYDDLTEDQKNAISEIQVDKLILGGDEDNGVVQKVKVKHYDKLKALEMLNKMLGYNAPDKQEISGNVNIPIGEWLK